MFRHRAKAVVGDPLSVGGGYIGISMAHDSADRHEVFRIVADRLESVTQRVEIPVSFDAQMVEELSGFLCDRTVRDILRPTSALDSVEEGFSTVLPSLGQPFLK